MLPLPFQIKINRMNRLLVFSIVSWGILSFFSCKTTKGVPAFKEKDKAMTLEKGSCLGKCAVYTLTIYKNKYALYEGRFNTDKIGKHYKLIPDTTYNQLKMLYEKAGFMNFDSVYTSDIADFPTIVVGYYLGKSPKTVTYKENKPDELSAIQRKLEHVANSFDWTPMQKSKENMEYTPMDVKRFEEDGVNIKNEIIIEPADGVNIEKWLENYEGYKLQIIRKVAPNFNYYIVGWDTNTIRPEEMLLKLKADQRVKTAEFNKKIMQREH